MFETDCVEDVCYSTSVKFKKKEEVPIHLWLDHFSRPLKERNISMNKIFEREFILLKGMYCFLEESQIMGRTLETFCIPNICGKIRKNCFRPSRMRKDSHTTSGKSKLDYYCTKLGGLAKKTTFKKTISKQNVKGNIPRYPSVVKIIHGSAKANIHKAGNTSLNKSLINEEKTNSERCTAAVVNKLETNGSSILKQASESKMKKTVRFDDEKLCTFAPTQFGTEENINLQNSHNEGFDFEIEPYEEYDITEYSSSSTSNNVSGSDLGGDLSPKMFLIDQKSDSPAEKEVLIKSKTNEHFYEGSDFKLIRNSTTMKEFQPCDEISPQMKEASDLTSSLCCLPNNIVVEETPSEPEKINKKHNTNLDSDETYHNMTDQTLNDYIPLSLTDGSDHICQSNAKERDSELTDINNARDTSCGIDYETGSKLIISNSISNINSEDQKVLSFPTSSESIKLYGSPSSSLSDRDYLSDDSEYASDDIENNVKRTITVHKEQIGSGTEQLQKEKSGKTNVEENINSQLSQENTQMRICGGSNEQENVDTLNKSNDNHEDIFISNNNLSQLKEVCLNTPNTVNFSSQHEDVTDNGINKLITLAPHKTIKTKPSSQILNEKIRFLDKENIHKNYLTEKKLSKELFPVHSTSCIGLLPTHLKDKASSNSLKITQSTVKSGFAETFMNENDSNLTTKNQMSINLSKNLHNLNSSVKETHINLNEQKGNILFHHNSSKQLKRYIGMTDDGLKRNVNSTENNSNFNEKCVNKNFTVSVTSVIPIENEDITNLNHNTSTEFFEDEFIPLSPEKITIVDLENTIESTVYTQPNSVTGNTGDLIINVNETENSKNEDEPIVEKFAVENPTPSVTSLSQNKNEDLANLNDNNSTEFFEDEFIPLSPEKITIVDLENTIESTVYTQPNSVTGNTGDLIINVNETENSKNEDEPIVEKFAVENPTPSVTSLSQNKNEDLASLNDNNSTGFFEDEFIPISQEKITTVDLENQIDSTVYIQPNSVTVNIGDLIINVNETENSKNEDEQIVENFAVENPTPSVTSLSQNKNEDLANLNDNNSTEFFEDEFIPISQEKITTVDLENQIDSTVYIQPNSVTVNIGDLIINVNETENSKNEDEQIVENFAVENPTPSVTSLSQNKNEDLANLNDNNSTEFFEDEFIPISQEKITTVDLENQIDSTVYIQPNSVTVNTGDLIINVNETENSKNEDEQIVENFVIENRKLSVNSLSQNENKDFANLSNNTSTEFFEDEFLPLSQEKITPLDLENKIDSTIHTQSNSVTVNTGDMIINVNETEDSKNKDEQIVENFAVENRTLSVNSLSQNENEDFVNESYSLSPESPKDKPFLLPSSPFNQDTLDLVNNMELSNGSYRSSLSNNDTFNKDEDLLFSKNNENHNLGVTNDISQEKYLELTSDSSVESLINWNSDIESKGNEIINNQLMSSPELVDNKKILKSENILKISGTTTEKQTVALTFSDNVYQEVSPFNKEDTQQPTTDTLKSVILENRSLLANTRNYVCTEENKHSEESYPPYFENKNGNVHLHDDSEQSKSKLTNLCAITKEVLIGNKKQGKIILNSSKEQYQTRNTYLQEIDNLDSVNISNNTQTRLTTNTTLRDNPIHDFSNNKLSVLLSAAETLDRGDSEKPFFGSKLSYAKSENMKISSCSIQPRREELNINSPVASTSSDYENKSIKSDTGSSTKCVSGRTHTVTPQQGTLLKTERSIELNQSLNKNPPIKTSVTHNPQKTYYSNSSASSSPLNKNKQTLLITSPFTVFTKFEENKHSEESYHSYFENKDGTVHLQDDSEQSKSKLTNLCAITKEVLIGNKKQEKIILNSSKEQYQTRNTYLQEIHNLDSVNISNNTQTRLTTNITVRNNPLQNFSNYKLSEAAETLDHGDSEKPFFGSKLSYAKSENMKTCSIQPRREELNTNSPVASTSSDYEDKSIKSDTGSSTKCVSGRTHTVTPQQGTLLKTERSIELNQSLNKNPPMKTSVTHNPQKTYYSNSSMSSSPLNKNKQTLLITSPFTVFTTFEENKHSEESYHSYFENKDGTVHLQDDSEQSKSKLTNLCAITKEVLICNKKQEKSLFNSSKEKHLTRNTYLQEIHNLEYGNTSNNTQTRLTKNTTLRDKPIHDFSNNNLCEAAKNLAHCDSEKRFFGSKLKFAKSEKMRIRSCSIQPRREELNINSPVASSDFEDKSIKSDLGTSTKCVSGRLHTVSPQRGTLLKTEHSIEFNQSLNKNPYIKTTVPFSPQQNYYSNSPISVSPLKINKHTQFITSPLTLSRNFERVNYVPSNSFCQTQKLLIDTTTYPLTPTETSKSYWNKNNDINEPMEDHCMTNNDIPKGKNKGNAEENIYSNDSDFLQDISQNSLNLSQSSSTFSIQKDLQFNINSNNLENENLSFSKKSEEDNLISSEISLSPNSEFDFDDEHFEKFPNDASLTKNNKRKHLKRKKYYSSDSENEVGLSFSEKSAEESHVSESSSSPNGQFHSDFDYRYKHFETFPNYATSTNKYKRKHHKRTDYYTSDSECEEVGLHKRTKKNSSDSIIKKDIDLKLKPNKFSFESIQPEITINSNTGNNNKHMKTNDLCSDDHMPSNLDSDVSSFNTDSHYPSLSGDETILASPCSEVAQETNTGDYLLAMFNDYKDPSDSDKTSYTSPLKGSSEQDYDIHF